ncbi:MAG TPA: hypothetical protein VN032_01080 [Thermoanaerobaculia bacterium]|jgi:hypothetical protein|nr:hypothetical protein [Thermoanaerobaculia bacterium]
MRTPWTVRLAGIALALWVASGAIAQGRVAQEPKDKDEESSGTDVLTPLLEQRLSGKVSADDVVVDIRWPFEGLYTSTRIYGNGVGIWKREFQIRLPRAEVRRLLKLLVTTRFGSLPHSFGRDEIKEESLKGRIVVSIGPVTKLVSQADGGEQSPALQTIAEQVIAASKKASAHEIGVSSFADGFQKFSVGTLAPEALRLEIRRRVSTVGGEGWLLRANGRRVYTENMEKVGVPGSARVLVLTPKDFAALAQALRDADPATLPQNLYAPEYTDILIQLLNKSRHIQARKFSGMTPESKGEKQAAFDRLLTTLVALHARAEKEGRIVKIPDQTQADAEERERESKEEERERERGPDKGDVPKPSVTPASPGRP